MEFLELSLGAFLAYWVLLALRSIYLEGRLHKVVRDYEPEIWERIGKPGYPSVSWALQNFSNSPLLKEVKHPKVIVAARRSRKGNKQFIYAFLGWILAVIVVGELF
ncbi:MAG: hypothetical protein OQK12_03945 [Motiliproteus sp.]|nr:hypothetical protein [Motiliproteus sp.]MCW9052070.1 hypothetical protein [Motiliproteus sp.]